MTATVRAFAHAGLEMALVTTAVQYSANGVFMLKYPPLGRSGVVTLSAVSAVSTPANMAPAGTTILRLEASPGTIVGYEVTRRNATGAGITAADVTSMRFIGNIEIPFGPGDVVSLIDATNF